MAGAPATDGEPADEQQPLYPFFDCGADLTPEGGERIRAGYMNEQGEVETLYVDVQDVGPQQLEQAFQTAYGWYIAQLRAIYSQEPAEEEPQVAEEPVEAE